MTTPSKTPRTDALDKDLEHDAIQIQSQGKKLSEVLRHVMAALFKHARQLETELQQCREANKAANDLIGAQANENDKIVSRLLSRLTSLEAVAKELAEACVQAGHEAVMTKNNCECPICKALAAYEKLNNPTQ